jgi:hypothetical protein
VSDDYVVERRSPIHIGCTLCAGPRTERDLGSGLCESCRVIRGEPSREDAKRERDG